MFSFITSFFREVIVYEDINRQITLKRSFFRTNKVCFVNKRKKTINYFDLTETETYYVIDNLINCCV